MQNLAETIIHLLVEKKMVLATAESCTGGLISSAITSISGSSNVFDRGFVTYSNQSKIDQLGVSPEVITSYGAVSYECAEAMALGALKNSTADISVSVTGIAGPTGGTLEKPLGLVFIGIGTLAHHSFVKEFHFEGDRGGIRNQAVREALNLLIEAVRAV